MLTYKQIVHRVRSRLDDQNPAKYLWTEHDILHNTNDTISDACIRANLVVVDDVEIPFTQDGNLDWNAKYPLPSGTLAVNSIYLASAPSVFLRQTSFRRLSQLNRFRPTQKGAPTFYALDQTMAGKGDDTGIVVRTVTFVPQPIKADTAMLEIARLPVAIEFDEDVPEMDEIYHPDLIYGITGLCYMKRDADTFNAKKAIDDMAIFESRFGPRLPASVMRERQTDIPYQMIVS
jgi:hypothetical protein